jgi:hypothetical protein
MSEIIKKALTDKDSRNSETLQQQGVTAAPWL